MIPNLFAPTLGLQLHIRRANTGDVYLLQQMYDRVSASSLQSRFLRSYRPTLEDSLRICRIHPDDGAAFVATVANPGETIVGYAYYVIGENPSLVTAEPAVMVEDRYQGQGIGRMLIDRLVEDAKSKGVQAFDALIHPSNEAIMSLIRRSGLEYESQFAYGLREVRVWLNRHRNV